VAFGFFKKPQEDQPEYYYKAGLECIKKGDNDGANRNWKISASTNHVSSIFNLALLNGMGGVSPYDIDYSAECYYKAAKLGHEALSGQIFRLEAADRAGYGFDNFVGQALQTTIKNQVNAFDMVCLCRFLGALCDVFQNHSEIIGYELDCARTSELPAVWNFIERTQVPETFYRGKEHSLEQDSPADKITDGLNSYFSALLDIGVDQEVVVFQRCTAVGYIISKSQFGTNSGKLLGLRDFYNA